MKDYRNIESTHPGRKDLATNVPVEDEMNTSYLPCLYEFASVRNKVRVKQKQQVTPSEARAHME